MSTVVLATKLHLPRLRPSFVPRPRLVERLDDGLDRRLTLVSAPAGFGKTTLVTEWVAGCGRPVAWVSLDEGDSDPTSFVTYVAAAMQEISTAVGQGVLGLLRSPQPPPIEVLLTTLLNDIATSSDEFVLVLDDYHLIDAGPVDGAVALLLERLPSQVHVVITTREDPQLPLARFRARGHMSELRAADLRFTPSETASFLNEVMGLNLSEEDVVALDARTEGWIAGLQLAAMSMRGHEDVSRFIESFTGSHRFVLDYLMEEVLRRQSEAVQTFLLRTSILDRLCAPLCDAMLLDAAASGQDTLESLERANLFLVPLDDERRWYRYHHLFADLLRQRLHQRTTSSTMADEVSEAELHVRASAWYEANGLEVEAFHHAAAAHDVDRAARLLEGDGVPLQFRGGMAHVLNWLASLPTEVLNASPSLWVTYTSVLTFSGHGADAEPKLHAAEAALRGVEPNATNRDLMGRIASMRAMLAMVQQQVETMVAQSLRALENLHPDNLPVRATAAWTLGHGYQLQGDRVAAGRTLAEAVALGQASGNSMVTIAATMLLGQVQESEHQLLQAAETYRGVLPLVGDPPWSAGCHAYLGLARVSYEWNDLEAAQRYGQVAVGLARQIENTDTPADSGVFLARLKRAHGDAVGAAEVLLEAERVLREHGFVRRLPDVAAARVVTLLQQGDVAAAAALAEKHDLPIGRARVHLALGKPAEALAVLAPLRRRAEEHAWADVRLEVMVLQAVANHARGEQELAVNLMADVLALARPGGLVRTFVDEGAPMARLLTDVVARGVEPDYVGTLLAAFETEKQRRGEPSSMAHLSEASALEAQRLDEPLSPRELEVLRLLAEGLSNPEIGKRLHRALDTVKGYNRRIFEKLQVRSRFEAVARARELGLL